MKCQLVPVNLQEKVVQALKKYACIVFSLTLLGVGLILFGIAGLANYDKHTTGPPYFISGIIVGCLELISALLCLRIIQTARQLSQDELQQGYLQSYIGYQVKLSTFSVIVSMLGILMALVGGFSKVLTHNHSESVNKFLAAVIVIGCSIAFCFEMYALYVANCYGKYFSLEASPERSPQRSRRYRPGLESGYLRKNLNTYMTSINSSIRRPTTPSPHTDNTSYQVLGEDKQQSILSGQPSPVPVSQRPVIEEPHYVNLPLLEKIAVNTSEEPDYVNVPGPSDREITSTENTQYVNVPLNSDSIKNDTGEDNKTSVTNNESGE